MKPEKKPKYATEEDYKNLGISEYLIPVFHKAGYFQIESIKKANPNKLYQELCGLRKKMKLDIPNPTIEEVKTWVES